MRRLGATAETALAPLEQKVREAPTHEEVTTLSALLARELAPPYLAAIPRRHGRAHAAHPRPQPTPKAVEGGVGRTTVAVNLAVAAAGMGRSVVLVDLHAGVWSAARHLGCAGNRGGPLAALSDPTAEGIRAAAERRHGVLVLSRGRDDGLFPALDREAVAALCRVAAQAYDLVVLDTASAPDDPGTYASCTSALTRA